MYTYMRLKVLIAHFCLGEDLSNFIQIVLQQSNNIKKYTHDILNFDEIFTLLC